MAVLEDRSKVSLQSKKRKFWYPVVGNEARAFQLFGNKNLQLIFERKALLINVIQYCIVHIIFTMYGKGMQIVPVSYADVKANPRNYNSSSHTAEEALGLIIPSDECIQFNLWAQLHADLGYYETVDIQKTFISAEHCKLFLEATTNTVHTGVIGLDYHEVVSAEIFPIFEHISFPPEGLSVRLDGCTPMDGDRGNCAVRNATETIIRLGSSKRSRVLIGAALRTEGIAGGLLIFFTPFNSALLTDHRYRVFCASPDGRMTAIR